MSRLEDIVYEAEALGVRTELFDAVNKLRSSSPKQPLDELYDKALDIVKNEAKNKRAEGDL